MDKSNITSRDDPKNILSGTVNKQIRLDEAKDDRDLVVAGMAALIYEAYPAGTVMPDDFHLSIDGQLRKRNQRPGAHAVICANITDKRKIGVNATTQPIDE